MQLIGIFAKKGEKSERHHIKGIRPFSISVSLRKCKVWCWKWNKYQWDTKLIDAYDKVLFLYLIWISHSSVTKSSDPKTKSKPVQVSVMDQKLAQWNIKFQMRHFVRKSPHKSKAKRKHWHELLDYVNTTDAVACTTIFTNRPFIGLLGPVGDVQKLKKKINEKSKQKSPKSLSTGHQCKGKICVRRFKGMFDKVYGRRQ